MIHGTAASTRDQELQHALVSKSYATDEFTFPVDAPTNCREVPLSLELWCESIHAQIGKIIDLDQSWSG